MALTPRYATEEKHGRRELKIRVIDDFKASEINGLLSTHDANIPGAMGAFLTTATYMNLLDGSVNSTAVSAYYRHAYENLAIDSDQTAFTSILLAPPSGPLLVAKIQALPFETWR